MQVDYHAKYLKYKQKYLDLKEEMIGSGRPPLKRQLNTDQVKQVLQEICKVLPSPDKIAELSVKFNTNEIDTIEKARNFLKNNTIC